MSCDRGLLGIFHAICPAHYRYFLLPPVFRLIQKIAVSQEVHNCHLLYKLQRSLQSLAGTAAMQNSWVKVEFEKTPFAIPTRVCEPKKSLPKGHWTYTLEMQTSKSLGPRNELEEYIQTIRGTIIAEQGNPSLIVREIGEIGIEIVQIRRIRKEGLSLSWVETFQSSPRE